MLNYNVPFFDRVIALYTNAAEVSIRVLSFRGDNPVDWMDLRCTDPSHEVMHLIGCKNHTAGVYLFCMRTGNVFF